MFIVASNLTNRLAKKPVGKLIVQGHLPWYKIFENLPFIFPHCRKVEGWSVFKVYLVGFDSLLEVGKAASFGCESNCLHRLHVWTRVSATIRI